MRFRPRVLHIGKFYPPHMGGIETHLQNLCEHVGSSADISVLVANDRRNTVEEVIGGVRLTRLGKILEVKSAAVCPGLVARIGRAEADIVHLHLPNPTAALAWLLSKQRARLVVTYHSDIVRQKVLAKMMNPMLHAVLARALAIIVTSPNYLATSETLQAHKNRCHSIPYGIPLEEFAPPDPDAVARIRERYGPKIVIAVGRLVYYKGFQYAIRAMCKVDATLLLIGDGPLRAELEKLVRGLGITRKVIFLGEVQNRAIVPYYHAADLFVLPSVARSEAFGIVQLEAMACGLPVVNTSLDSGVPFVSQNGVTGITVAPGNSNALAGAMNDLLENANMRRVYGTAGRKRVHEEFSVSVMVNRTLELYRSVLGAAPVDTFETPEKISN